VRPNADVESWMDLAVEAGQLREALTSRPTIDLAKGVVMAARRCSADEAFAELRRLSSRHNVKIVRLSDAVVRLVQQRTDQLARSDADGSPEELVAAHLLRELGYARTAVSEDQQATG
jgi:hypothetical protein